MESKAIKVKHYQAWFSAETMHSNSIKWLSQLRFVKDEQQFLDDLVKSYTLKLIDSKHFAKSKTIVRQLNRLQKETHILIDSIVKHEKTLQIMVDGINQIQEENAYRAAHIKLKSQVGDFFIKYRSLKTQLFSLIKGIIKEEKQNRLLE
ncbi:hypothetical protein [Gelatiniphilus marinus]|uniref:Uncharacterized protein n=1 Tax=Gelatiniphilus marinus TaxID=1759464 RepID=A0ABW5JP76_9FLAO